MYNVLGQLQIFQAKKLYLEYTALPWFINVVINWISMCQIILLILMYWTLNSSTMNAALAQFNVECQ